MEKITIISMSKTRRTEGVLKLRFRLRDGRKADLSFRSGIEASLADLVKFNEDGSLRRGVSVYNESLYSEINNVAEAMKGAYKYMREANTVTTSESFQREVEKILNPEQSMTPKKGLVDRFAQFIEEQRTSGVIGDGILRQYTALLADLKRFVTIKRLAGIAASQIGSKELAMLRDFLINECDYVEKWPSVYKDMRKGKIPREPRSGNTIANKMRILRAMYNYMLRERELSLSPFQTLNKDRRRVIMGTQYDEPVALELSEFDKLLASEVPEGMQEAKDALVLLCCIGARITDFDRLTMDNVAVTPSGHPYIHYRPAKTSRLGNTNKEVETPIMRCAIEIVKKHKMDFPCLKNQSAFNENVREILKLCDIGRKCPVRGEDGNEYKPLWELASSKIGRKTHVSLMASVEPDAYAAGLHARGSSAVNRYLHKSVDTKFQLACTAYGQPPYRVDTELNVIEDEAQAGYDSASLLEAIDRLSNEEREILLAKLMGK